MSGKKIGKYVEEEEIGFGDVAKKVGSWFGGDNTKKSLTKSLKERGAPKKGKGKKS